MKKMLLRIRILLTNISRIIMSFLFVNLNFSYLNRVFGVSINNLDTQITCYDVVPAAPTIEETNTLTLKNILIILVPVAIITGVVVLIIKKKKSKSKEEKKDAKKD